MNEQQAAKAAEHDKKEEEQYKASMQSPKVRSRSGSLGGDYGKTVTKSSPRATATPSTSDFIMIVRAPSRESKDTSDKGYTFVHAISSAMRVITTNQKKISPSAGSPKIQSPTQQLSPRAEQAAEGTPPSAAVLPQRP